MFYERSTHPLWKMWANIYWGHRMHHTGLISMVKISMQACYHFDRLKFKQNFAMAFLNFLKLFQMETGTHKYIKINVSWSINTCVENTSHYTALGWSLFKTHVPGFCHFHVKFKQTMGIFRFLKTFFRWKRASKVHKNLMLYEVSAAVWKTSTDKA